MDFAEARQQALLQIQQTASCRVLTLPEIRRRKLTRFTEVWILDSEVFRPDGNVQPIQFLLGLPADFPLVLPTILLERADYERLRYLPHIDSSGLICVFDSETVRVNPEDSYGILRACVLQARRLIEQGMVGDNALDFQHEFIAYWKDHYTAQDVVETGLALTEEVLPIGSLSLLYLTKAFGGYSLVLPTDTASAKSFTELLKRHGVGAEAGPAFHLGELGDIRPPFNLNNGAALELARRHFPTQWNSLQRFLNLAQAAVLVVFHRRLAGKVLYFGWLHSRPQMKRKGFRPCKFEVVEALTSFERNKSVLRLSFDALTSQRLLRRTAGEVPVRTYTLLLAGLGSIGSNLLPALASLPLEEMRLVDPETLTLENINRHLLGLDYINHGKADGLRRHLELHQPLRLVSTRQDSVVQVAIREPAYFNDCDAIILAVGKSTVEQHLLYLQTQGILNSPFFILWVEPYLTGGHLLYFPPGHTIEYGALFEEGYYKYNMLSTAEYQKPGNQLLLKEAGCQTSYVPYSQEYVALFLARIFPEMRQLLRTPSSEAWAFTWLGNTDAINLQNLTPSSLASRMSEGELFKAKL